MELAGLLISSIGFILTLAGVAIAIHQASDARRLAAQANELLEQMKSLAEAHTQMSKTVGEISVIDAYMTRELGDPTPDMELIARQYAALLTRAIRLVGGEAALQDMVGELH